jgi:hypothetical protein
MLSGEERAVRIDQWGEGKMKIVTPRLGVPTFTKNVKVGQPRDFIRIPSGKCEQKM